MDNRFPDHLRIAFCLPGLRPLQQVLSEKAGDAAYIQQKYIAMGLQARGHDLTFVAPQGLSDIICTHDPMQVTIAPRSWTASRTFDAVSKGTWEVQRRLGVPYLNFFSSYRSYDACMRCLPGHHLVYERNGLYNVGVAMASRRLKLPYVAFFDADQIAEHDFMGKPITGLLRWRAQEMLRYNLHTARCVVCVSETAKMNLTTQWRVPSEKTVVFANGVDVERFRPLPETREEVRTALAVGSGPVLLFVGNFYEWHDVATLLDAFALFVKRCPEACLVLVGDGPQKAAMVQRSVDIGVTHAVRFTGLVAHHEVPHLMAAADIAVAPYPAMQGDLWLSPMKLFEYMASGLAVIASAAGQLVDVIDDGCNGMLVPPGDPAALSSALWRLSEDADLRIRLGKRAREDAVCKHSWDQYLAHLESVFMAVIEGRSFGIFDPGNRTISQANH